jgi:Mn2+/Fe2+ NRAMP family transporter
MRLPNTRERAQPGPVSARVTDVLGATAGLCLLLAGGLVVLVGWRWHADGRSARELLTTELVLAALAWAAVELVTSRRLDERLRRAAGSAKNLDDEPSRSLAWIAALTALGWVVAPIVAYAAAQALVLAGDALYRGPAWSAALLLAGALLGVGSANARIRGGVIDQEKRRQVEFLSRGPVLGLFRPGADVKARVHRQ